MLPAVVQHLIAISLTNIPTALQIAAIRPSTESATYTSTFPISYAQQIQY